MTWSLALRLGRVSNLPTVWSNVAAGVVLASGDASALRLLWLCLGLSLLYVAGMFLNDAFDAQIDAVERPERPIPSGKIAARQVFAWGYGLLLSGVILVSVESSVFGVGPRLAPALSSIGLALLIVYYDAHHKQNALSPLIMGLCRVGVYVTAGLATSVAPKPELFFGALGLLCYLIGLTYVAKQENLLAINNTWPLVFIFLPLLLPSVIADSSAWAWPCALGFLVWVLHSLRYLRRVPKRIPRAVVSLIAGISLLDALFIAALGKPALAGAAILAFALTLTLQRHVPGT